MMTYKDQIKTMEQMAVGDRLAPDNNTTIIRVITGWVFSNTQGCCFIPRTLI